MPTATVRVLVEIPKGSRNKYELDKTTGRVALDRVLYSSVHYPTDYGFVVDTLGADGDPLDVLVLIAEPTFPGCQIDCRVVGMFLMHDEKGQDEKILCVPLADPFSAHVKTLADVSPHLLREVEHFFQIYKDLEGKPTATFGWRERDEAIDVVERAQARYKT